MLNPIVPPPAPFLAPLASAAAGNAVDSQPRPGRMAIDRYLPATQPKVLAGGGSMGVLDLLRSLWSTLMSFFKGPGGSAPAAQMALPATYAPAPTAPTLAPAAPSLVGPVPLEGYDGSKLNDASHRTPKYLFGRVASHYPLDSVHDKASAEALLNRMVPDMRAAGLEIAGVRGDKIEVKTEVGYEWVDVVARSGAPNPGWWWGSEGKGTPSPT